MAQVTAIVALDILLDGLCPTGLLHDNDQLIGWYVAEKRVSPEEAAREVAKLKLEATRLVTFADSHSLDASGVEAVVFAKREYGASRTKIGTLVKSGHAIDDVLSAYETRSYFSSEFGHAGLPALDTLLEAMEYFMDSEDEDYFQELITDLPAVYPKIEYNSSVLKVALKEAKQHRIVYLGELIERKRDDLR